MFRCSLRPSKLLRLWITAWALLLLWPIWFSALPWWLCLIIDIGVLIWMVVTLRKHQWHPEKSLSYGEGVWILKQGGGDKEERLTIIGEFYLSQWLIVLNCKNLTGKRVDLILLPDSTDKDSLRRLRVLLKQMPKSQSAT